MTICFEDSFFLPLFMQMEVECALLEGEQESEMAQLQRDKEVLDTLLKKKISCTENTNHQEKSQVKTYQMIKP